MCCVFFLVSGSRNCPLSLSFSFSLIQNRCPIVLPYNTHSRVFPLLVFDVFLSISYMFSLFCSLVRLPTPSLFIELSDGESVYFSIYMCLSSIILAAVRLFVAFLRKIKIKRNALNHPLALPITDSPCKPIARCCWLPVFVQMASSAYILYVSNVYY